MIRSGNRMIPLASYLREEILKSIRIHQSKVETAIKQDGYERVFRLLMKQRHRTSSSSGAAKSTLMCIGTDKESSEGSAIVGFQETRSLLSTNNQNSVLIVGTYINTAVEPPIPAIVGSLDTLADRYTTMVRAQTHREKIESLGEGCLDLVRMHVDESGERPNHIVIFRYGVSTELLQEEMNELALSFARSRYNPMVTFMLAERLHSEGIRDDKFEFFGYNQSIVSFKYKSFGNKIHDVSEFLSYISEKCAHLFRIAPPIVFAYLAALKEHNGDLGTWRSEGEAETFYEEIANIA